MYVHVPAADAAERADERRVDLRQMVLKRARLFPIKDLVQLAVRNLSSGGLRGEARAGSLALQPIHASLDGHRFSRGQVRWIDGPQFGMSLDHPLPPPHAAIGQTMPPDEADLRREQRFEFEAGLTIGLCHPMIEGVARNISKGGAQVQMFQPLPEGTLVLFELPGKPALLSRVQWKYGMSMGLKFSATAPEDILSLSHI